MTVDREGSVGKLSVVQRIALSLASALDRDDATSFRINNFDLLRIFAATQVLVFHSLARFNLAAPVWIKPFVILPGVPIFFVISGFLVSASFERQRDIPRYARNRAYRIFPGLWVCIVVTLIFVLALGFRPVRLLDYVWLPAQLLGFIFTPPFLKDFGIGSYNGSLWTIPIELQFYVTVPLLYRWVMVGRFATAKLATILLFFMLARLCITLAFPGFGVEDDHGLSKIVRYTFVPHYYLFLWGVLLQTLGVGRMRLFRGKGLYWLATYLLLKQLPLNGIITGLIDDLVLGSTVVSMAYTLPTLSGTILGEFDISYGVYIYHGLLINIIRQLGGTSYNTITVGIVFVGAFLLGAISWLFVESPFILRKKRDARPRDGS